MPTIKSLALLGATVSMLGACSANDAANSSAAATNNGTSATHATSTGRVRGIVQAVNGDTLTVQTYDGQSVTVSMDSKTGYAWVVSSSLATLKDGDFIGTATSGPATALCAVELVIFPARPSVLGKAAKIRHFHRASIGGPL